MAAQTDSAIWALDAGQMSLPIRAANGPLRFIATGLWQQLWKLARHFHSLGEKS